MSKRRKRYASSQFATILNGTNQYWQKTSPTNLDLNGAELLANPTFDAGVSNWGAVAGITLAYETVVKRTGAGSAKMTSDGTANGTIISDGIANTATNKYTIEFWVFIPAASTGKTVNILIVNESNSAIYSSPNVTITADTWTKLVLNTGALTGAQTQIKARLRYVNPSAGDILYVDDVSLTQAYDAIVMTGFSTIVNGTRIINNIGSGSVGFGISVSTPGNKAVGFVTDGINNYITSGILSDVTDGKKHSFATVINRGTSINGYTDGIYSGTFSITGMGKVNTSNPLYIGFNGTATYFNGIIYPTQIIIFQSGLPADGGASIIADAYNRFISKKPLATIYPGGTVVASYDWRAQGRDISGNGNDLAPVNSPQIIKI